MSYTECDCEVVDDPDMVCPKHQGLLLEYVKSLEAERNQWKERFHAADNLLTIEKAKAEKLAEALKEFRDLGCDLHGNHDTHGWAKQALAEYEKGLQ